MDTVRYNCSENDNYIIAFIENSAKNEKPWIEELHFGIEGDSSRLVFGIKDIKRALNLFNKKL